MADIIVKKGDATTTIQWSLVDSTGVAVNITGASVKFVMRALTATSPVTNLPATIVTPTPAVVSYTFTAPDTATAGLYQASWIVTGGPAPGTYPTIGFMEIEIGEDLVTATPVGRLVGLGETREHLNFGTTDRSHDSELMRFIDAITPVVEGITGPIVQRAYSERYDGGQPFLSLRHRPIVAVTNVVEYRGPIPYVLTQVPSPDLGTIYSYMWEPSGRVVRRTVGGGMTSFPGGLETVTIDYIAGYQTVPANVRLGCLELIRVNYQQTQQMAPRRFGGGAGGNDDALAYAPPLAIFVPGRVRELLLPNRRRPSIV